MDAGIALEDEQDFDDGENIILDGTGISAPAGIFVRSVVKVVKNSEEAIKHINKYGTMHTDSIITKNKKTAKYFLKNVKSSIAMHNTSTQFADGGEFGFGGEVGISTNTLPPRGPVGLNQLISYKYEITSNGKIRN